MEFFVNKLNLQPSIINAYNGNMKQLTEEVIPNDLKKIFTLLNYYSDGLLEFSAKLDSVETIQNDNTYQEILKLSEKMKKARENIIKKYEFGKGIIYPDSYLKMRDKLNYNIQELLKKYPILNNADNVRNFDFEVEKFTNVGIGVTYIKRAFKIKKYIELTSEKEEQEEIRFIYNPNTEHIYISTNNKSNVELDNELIALENEINKYSNLTNMGVISLAPIYEAFEIKGSYNQITVKIVYPNGDPARDRSKAIEKMNAAEETRTFKSSENEKLNAEVIKEIYEEDGQQGYVKSVTSNRKNILEKIYKRITLTLGGNESERSR